MKVGQDYERVSMYEVMEPDDIKWVGQIVRVKRLTPKSVWFLRINRRTKRISTVSVSLASFKKHFKLIVTNLENK